MIYLITGVPGASKTLNTIKFVCEDSAFKDRPVFYHNIKQLTLDWTLIEDPHTWQTLPEGSVIILDEAQDHFGARPNTREVPETIKQLSKHRHRGYDIIFITQHPNLLDVFIRRLVNYHVHYHRPFGSKVVSKLTWQKAKNPDDYHDKQEAQKETARIDKKYFGVYKSAEVHTHKLRIPKKLFFLLALIAGLVFFAMSFYDRNLNPDKAPDIVTSGSVQPVLSSPFGTPDTENIPPEKLFEPRLLGLPHTAPAYDKITEPKIAPWPNCIEWHNGECRCYTQQATRIRTISRQVCQAIVRDGLFNPMISHNPEPQRAAPQGREVSEATPTGGRS